MENIKTFDTVEEAFAYRPIWPDYDLQYDAYHVGCKTHVRKQNKDGVWYLIPVVQRFEFTPIPEVDFIEDRESYEIKQVKELLDLVKRFNDSCYRVLLFYVVPDEGKFYEVGGRPIGGELDKDQRSERDRLIPVMDTVTTKQAL
jgi:hypothetical protein